MPPVRKGAFGHFTVPRTLLWFSPEGLRQSTALDNLAPRYLRPRLPPGRWERAEPAALFDAFEVRPSRSTFDAALAAFLLVTLLRAICYHRLSAGGPGSSKL